MPLPRYKQINLDVTPFYHCTSRCVGQSFLCGKDSVSGKNFEHRRQWVEDRLHQLTRVFAIELCAYAVMHNHTHLVVHVAKAKAYNWSMDEVLLRWRSFYKCPSVVQRYLEDEASLSETEYTLVMEYAAQYRERLCSVSWFMRLLNEYIARRANKEDNCTGYFWERRFRSQALLNEKAVIAAMAYTDLNPVRARLAKSPEDSHFTSIRYRINADRAGKTPRYLKPFFDGCSSENDNPLPISLVDYLTLVDETGRAVREDKRGYICQKLAPILDRLKMKSSAWLTVSTQLEAKFSGPVGSPLCIGNFTRQCNYGRRPHITNAKRYFM